MAGRIIIQIGAPAFIFLSAVSLSLCMLKAITQIYGSSFIIFAAASIPFLIGMETSIRMTLGAIPTPSVSRLDRPPPAHHLESFFIL
jgi:hypothetical protein